MDHRIRGHKRRVGILGFGKLGKFLASKISESNSFELAFVWNRTASAFDESVDSSLILDSIDDFKSKKPDIVVEVAHPSVTKIYGKHILEYCDYMIGSPTALCDENLLEDLKVAAAVNTLYIPSGALWGGEDIRKMSDSGILESLCVTMKKHPDSLKLEGYLKDKNAEVKEKASVLYKGCVRNVCELAPHNTNTMAAAALAAPNLGFKGVTGCLVSDPSLVDYHIVEIEGFGAAKADGTRFQVHTIRKNPSKIGEVTGFATSAAFIGSLQNAVAKGPGIHLC
ncbi:putative L-aspartate dehydrogenase [Trichonephila inaurata madagascariensis]|uniref:Aspartate dehydrogenase domain-containing protein n=1 Tax=Trichonephila inaurata madagascariensis TaxID=2747483 RepID=A0A8X6YH47_9ARAC|nr:putative L-aspartate dehydrogenase [Trichonephila inaurata madagascariensis]